AGPAAEPDPQLLQLRGERPLAGMVTALRPQKDPLLAVRAMARLAARGNVPGRLAIVGSGPLEAEVRSEIDRLDLGEHVTWVPYGGSVTPYLKAFDVFVLSSAWEALPLSVLEAMSCGLPVVATAVGGVPDAVADGVTGRLVPHGDEEALASAILGSGPALTLARGWRRRGYAVLCYHRLREPTAFDDPTFVISPERFREHVEVLSRLGQVVGLDDLAAAGTPSDRPRVV